MIEIILIIAIAAEIIASVLIIRKMNILTEQACILNRRLNLSLFGLLFYTFKTAVIVFNKKLQEINLNNETETQTENLSKIVNSLVLIFSVFNWLSNKKKYIHEKKSLVLSEKHK